MCWVAVGGDQSWTLCLWGPELIPGQSNAPIICASQHVIGATILRANRLLARAEYVIASGRLTIIGLGLERLLRKYNPAQPRVPAGRPTGGQWTRTRVAGRWNDGNYAKCEAQYESDMFQCRMTVWSPACSNQAMLRRTACMKDDPLPPFNY